MRIFQQVYWAVRHGVNTLRGHEECDPFQLAGTLLNKPLCYDVGASTGSSVERMLLHLSPRQIHSFEPEPSSMAVLQSKYGKHPKVVLSDLAASDCVGSLPLQIHRERPFNTSFNTFKGADDSDIITKEIQTTTLDAYIELHGCPDLLKLDIEGHEDRALRGVEANIAKIGIVILELLFWHPYEEQCDWLDLLTTLRKTHVLIGLEIESLKGGLIRVGNAVFARPDLAPDTYRKPMMEPLI